MQKQGFSSKTEEKNYKELTKGIFNEKIDVYI